MCQCLESRSSLALFCKHSPLPLSKHFQMLPSCCRTVGGNTKQAERKSRKDGGDVEDGGGMEWGHLNVPRGCKASLLVHHTECKGKRTFISGISSLVDWLTTDDDSVVDFSIRSHFGHKWVKDPDITFVKYAKRNKACLLISHRHFHGLFTTLKASFWMFWIFVPITRSYNRLLGKKKLEGWPLPKKNEPEKNRVFQIHSRKLQQTC